MIKYIFTIIILLIATADFLFAAPPMTIWNAENTASVRVSTITGAMATDVAGSTISVSNFPTDYPDAGANTKLTVLTSTTNALFRAGQSIGNTHFDVSHSTISINNFPPVQSVSQSGDWRIIKATVVVENPVTSVAVNNFPAIYSVTGSTVVMIQRDTRDYHFAIRNDPTQPDRYLRVNSFNGLDIRLQNNLGTLISTTAPLPIADHSVWISSYTETNSSGVIKTGATDIARVIIGTGGGASSLVIRDGITDTAPIVAVIDTATHQSFELGFRLATGLFITATGTTPARLTIVYR